MNFLRVRKIQNEDGYYPDPDSGSYHAPIMNGFGSKPTNFFGKIQPQTETERRIRSGYYFDKQQCKNYIDDKYIDCFYELDKHITGEEGIEKMPKDDIMGWVKLYIDKIPNWEKPSDIIKSNKNAALGLFYTIRKGNGEKINKKKFLKKYDIKEQHLNKVLQFLNRIYIESRKKLMETDIVINNKLLEEEDDNDIDDVEVYFDRLYARWYRFLDIKKRRINRQKRFNHYRKDLHFSKSPVNVSEGNPFHGFMLSMFYLKFLRECEDAHYEYLLKNKVFYRSGALFINIDLPSIKIPIDFLKRFSQYKEDKALQIFVEQLIDHLNKKSVETIYEYDENIDFYKKSLEKTIQKLPINFIQIITESGFTPPVLAKLKDAGAEIIGHSLLHMKALLIDNPPENSGLVFTGNLTEQSFSESFDIGLFLNSNQKQIIMSILKSWKSKYMMNYIGDKPIHNMAARRYQIWNPDKMKIDVKEQEIEDLGDIDGENLDNYTNFEPVLNFPQKYQDTVKNIKFIWRNNPPHLPSKAQPLENLPEKEFKRLPENLQKTLEQIKIYKLGNEKYIRLENNEDLNLIKEISHIINAKIVI